MNVLIYQPHRDSLTETFIRAHAECLPHAVTVVHGYPAQHEGETVLSYGASARAFRRIDRLVRRKATSWEMTRSLLAAFRKFRPDVVLAEYGTSGVLVREACELAEVPLIVHFHGFDASIHEVLKVQGEGYRKLFASAFAIVAVSRAMQKRLSEFGSPEKIHYLPYGVDTHQFAAGEPQKAPPVFIAVGRFVEKKGPHLTIAAFAEVRKVRPAAELRFIGEGPLLPVCRDLAAALGVQNAVHFLGGQPHDRVATELRAARAFVQHSLVASDGDEEGTPVAILEASASGLPVIATRHAGIPDVVDHDKTGFLVAERDVASMARHMLTLIDDPGLARAMGRRGRQKICEQFSMGGRVAALAELLQSSRSSLAQPYQRWYPVRSLSKVWLGSSVGRARES